MDRKMLRMIIAMTVWLTIASSTISNIPDSQWSDIVRPGCLVEDIGVVYPITEHIQAKIDLELIPELEQSIIRQNNVAQRIVIELASIKDMDEDLRAPLSHLLSSATEALKEVLQPLPYERKKRGLFNIGGSLANFLFGITTDTALSSKLDVQNQKIASVVKSFSTALDTFTDINAKLNTLRTTANTISSSIFTMANQTNKLKQF